MPVSTGVLTSLVIVETIVLALLAVVVVSLLRSHAELLRRLPEPDEENFFTLFGRRVKNTLDTIDTPKWMQPNSNSSPTQSSGGFKTPKWFRSDSEDNVSSPRTGGGAASNFFGFFGAGGGSGGGGGNAGGNNQGRIVI